ncbi:glutathione S-transferase [Sneathiella sp. CAU 1612]|uniref:Glutathione S-transferase n=1 Tax=Sneathiella sedimenti TaxID=2816034 RepID=A0ABS3F198_9PROT|nr:glutathione S-transferase [Sneathiella sedimenti]MBO0332281.1 glutathione S-transferase [Sneathiella sedimenti]
MPRLANRPEEFLLPVLYSFRRCPYAMRARMAIAYSGVTVELRDILLKDKPKDMVAASPKATVPVLSLPDGSVLEESLDIMLWALTQNDPNRWLPEDTAKRDQIFPLIEENDGPFKTSLDRYKYHVCFPEKPREAYRQEGEEFFEKLERNLSEHRYLVGDNITLADTAIFPFIRQFANSDTKWFDASPYPRLRHWLDDFLSSERFAYIMKKRPIWTEGTVGELFPDRDAA